MKTLLGYLLPPLIGAVIGFVTNAIAIKMLFRPLKEIRLFGGGVRLPFTPGILPRQRHKLADSIGGMVERELLTPQILRERLKTDRVREGVAQAVSGFTEKLLSAPLSDLITKLSDHASAGNAVEILRDFSRSRVFNELVDALLASLLEAALGNADRDAANAGRPLLSLSIPEILGKERTVILREKQDALIREALNGKMPELPFKIRPFFQDFYPRASASLLKLLNKPEIHRGLETQGRIFMENAIRKLSVFQRFFVSAGQYDRTLSDRMPEIIDGLIVQLEELFADGAIRTRITDYLSDAVLSLAAEPDSCRRMVELVSGALFSFEDRPIGELLGKLGIDGIPGLIAALCRFFGKAGDDGEGSNGAAGAVFALLKRFFEERAGMTAAELFLIGEEKKHRIDTGIQEKLLSLADKQTESVLSTINVRAMVTQRIDALDMLRVERIVLDVMAGQLKWINFFGAILGAAIGGVQVVVSSILK
jgi:hypothetical protein